MSKPKPKPILYNSKRGVVEFSNFFMPNEVPWTVEGQYQKEKHASKIVKAFYNRLDRVRDPKEFVYFLKLLQPKKKNWTEKKERYWFADAKTPLRGILAKLLSGVFSNPRRSKAVAEFLGIPVAEVVAQDPTFNKRKLQLMGKLMYRKFKHKDLRRKLVETGKRKLHEVPLRGQGNDWTYKPSTGFGGDLHGRILRKVRSEIVRRLKRRAGR